MKKENIIFITCTKRYRTQLIANFIFFKTQTIAPIINKTNKKVKSVNEPVFLDIYSN